MRHTLRAGALSTAIALMMTLTAPVALAQEARPVAAVEQGTPAPNEADVASPDAIVAALYDVISGPAGKARDWNRLRSLFAPQAKMLAVGNRPDGTSPAAVMTVDDYIGRVTKPFNDAGFYETELARTSEAFGPIVHVFSTYESRHAPADAKPFQRGINSIQLTFDGRRWWIASLVWRGRNGQAAPCPGST